MSHDSTDYRRPQVATIDGRQIVETLGPASAYGLQKAQMSDMRQLVRKADLLR